MRDLRDRDRGDQRLVALHVHDDLLVVPAEAARELRDPVRSTRVLRGRELGLRAERAAGRDDALVVGRDDHLARAAAQRLPVDPLDHRLARDVLERLAG